MKIVVTGGMGFIGSHFVNLVGRLHPEFQIFVIDKLTYASSMTNIKVPITFIKQDICDLTELPECDYLVNFAAESHVDNSIKNGKPFVKTNVEGTFNLIELCRKSKDIKKFIHISTDEVYGDRDFDGKLVLADENSMVHTSSYYSATKASSDLLVLSAHRTYGLPYIITRTCNNFGENQHTEKMIPKIIQSIRVGSEIPVYGDGEQIREWIHADDNSMSIYKIMMSDIVNETFNIGSQYRISNNELIKIVGNIIGSEPKYKYVKDRLGHDRMYGLNSNKFITMFGNPVTVNMKEWLHKILIT